jgi:hypothetical protein
MHIPTFAEDVYAYKKKWKKIEMDASTQVAQWPGLGCAQRRRGRRWREKKPNWARGVRESGSLWRKASYTSSERPHTPLEP